MLRYWYILQVINGTEGSFLRGNDPLRTCINDVFVPMVETTKKHRRFAGVRKLQRRPAFSGYVFIQASSEPNWQRIKRDTRVLQAVSMVDKEPYIFPDIAIEMLKLKELDNFGLPRDDQGPLVDWKPGMSVYKEVATQKMMMVITHVKDDEVHLESCHKYPIKTVVSKSELSKLGEA